MSEPDGAVFYIRPIPGSNVSAQEVNDTLATRFHCAGVAITGPDGPEVLPDGTYEVRTFGPAGAEALGMALRYCFWEVDREIAWTEWEAAQR